MAGSVRRARQPRAGLLRQPGGLLLLLLVLVLHAHADAPPCRPLQGQVLSVHTEQWIQERLGHGPKFVLRETFVAWPVPDAPEGRLAGAKTSVFSHMEKKSMFPDS